MPEVVFKLASTAEEFAQIHRLNHRTFAEELGQHSATADGLLVDRFHAQNRYYLAQVRGRVAGMISVHEQSPFSVEKRLPHPERLAQMFPRPCEVRLLAIEPGLRHRTILAGLFWCVYDHARQHGYSHMLISGVEDRLPMYLALGFEPLGPAVAEGASRFVPMALDLRQQPPGLRRKTPHFEAWWQRHRAEPLSLLPGPVAIGVDVRTAFRRPVLSHREERFLEVYRRVRSLLGDLTGGMGTAMVTGSGTLANDIVAACLRSAFGDSPGLVLANGEFGERLIAQARRAGLVFESLTWHWGSAWNFDQVEAALTRGAAWVWAVHLETSTGQLNHLPRLSTMCSRFGAALAADCVSSLGAVPLDGLDLFLASGVSGKAIGSYAGQAFVFAGEDALSRIQFDHLPATFDLRDAMRSDAPMFTIASPQLLALEQAMLANYLDARTAADRFRHYERLGQWAREQLRSAAIEPLVSGPGAAPTIATFRLPNKETPQLCREAGFLIAYESGYLRQRGWGQIGVMGELDEQAIEPLFSILREQSTHAAKAEQLNAIVG